MARGRDLLAHALRRRPGRGHEGPRPGRKGVLALPLTKSGQRSGQPESVTIYDPLVAALLCLLLEQLPVASSLWNGSPDEFRQEFRRHLEALGVDPS